MPFRTISPGSSRPNVVCLNMPYADGGYENSTRIYGGQGWNMQARSSVSVDGRVNDPSVTPLPKIYQP